MKEVLVTGGAGFIGSNIVERAVEMGLAVTVLDNLSTGDTENLSEVEDKIEFIHGACSEIPDLDLGSPDTIFHIGIPSSSPMYREEPRLMGRAINEFVEVMELADKVEANVVFAASSSVYGRCEPPHRENMKIEAFDYYTEARLAMERIAKVYNQLHGVKTVGLRFFSVYGPHESAKGRYANIVSQFIWKMKDGERPKIYGDGEQTRDFTHVSDVVDACMAAAKSELEYEIINVGTGRETSFNQVIKIINEKLGKSIEPEYIQNPIENYVYRTLADISKARNLLDYEPSIDLEEGVERKMEEEE